MGIKNRVIGVYVTNGGARVAAFGIVDRLDRAGNMDYVAHHLVYCETKFNKLTSVMDQFNDMIAEYDPHVLILEHDWYAKPNKNLSGKEIINQIAHMGRVQGVVMASCVNMRIEFTAPKKWRDIMGGPGYTARQVRGALTRYLGLKILVEPVESLALGMACYGALRRR